MNRDLRFVIAVCFCAGIAYRMKFRHHSPQEISIQMSPSLGEAGSSAETMRFFAVHMR